MIKKIIITCLLLVNILHAAAINTSKPQYAPNEHISVNFTGMTAKNRDWVGIYPAGSSNAWGNVILWQWTEDVTNGNLNFNALPVGNYEVRSFYNNSFTTVAIKAFTVAVAQDNAAITTTKDVYAPNEKVQVNFTGMAAKNRDWVGIYPAGSTNAWGNVIDWKWTSDTTNGNLTFNNLPIGNYEVRSFYNNSFTLVARKQFSIEANDAVATLTATKDIYNVNDDVRINFANINGSTRDWLAIYPAGSSNAWGNVIEWKWNAGGVTEGQANFGKLPDGNYEARVFYNNTFHLEARVAFKVEDNVPLTTLYEDAEGGFDQAWFAGNQNARPTIINQGAGSAHSVRVPRTGGGFSFNKPPKKMKYLILDTRVGTASHVGNFGVKVKTTHGTRRILFSSYLNHPGNDFSGNAIPTPPFISHDGYIHNHPGPTDYYLDTRNGNFIHYKINIEEKLHMLEPDNELLSITLFTSAGGDFDNIKLSSH